MVATLNKNTHAWIARALGSTTMSGEKEQEKQEVNADSGAAPAWVASAALRPPVAASLSEVAVASSENLTEEEYLVKLEDLKRRCDNLCTSLSSMFLNLERTQPNSTVPPEVKQRLVDAQEQISELGQPERSTFSAARH